MMDRALLEKLERCSSLPSLPAVAIEILDLCQKDDSGKITDAIARDPALSIKLLKTANSPMFAMRSEVSTISSAVSVLGTNAIRTLVLSFTLVGGNKSAGLSSNYWRRSLLSAMAAREIASFCGSDREEAFLAGLLQDIGMLALSRVASVPYSKILQEAGLDHDRLAQLELAAFGVGHPEVGAWLLTRWKAPKLLAEAVAGSHPSETPPVISNVGGAVNLGELAALAGRFADLWSGDPKTAPINLVETIKKRWAGAILIEPVSAHLLAYAPQLAPLFEVKLSAEEMADVLEQAQEAMLNLSMQSTQEVQTANAALARLETRTADLLAEAQRDALTGVANRGYTDKYLDEVFSAAIEANRTIGVIFADVDHFKRVNDNHGHGAGDAILKSVSQCISSSVRGGDFVGRYGGEEFVVIVRADSIDELGAVAERIRSNMASKPHFIDSGSSLQITISLGSTLLNPAIHRTPAEFLSEADSALYAAKRAGRNCHISSSAKSLANAEVAAG